MALIPPFFIDCVVAIGSRNPKGEKCWFGTGFLVGRHHKEAPAEQKNYHLFLVTNKHVLKNVESIIVRFNPKTEEPARDYDISLAPRKELLMVGHPDPDIDVVVISINADVLQKEQARFAFFALDEHALQIADIKEHGTSEGDFVYVLGFPMGIVSSDRQYVIVRSGVIARLRDTVDQKSREFLIDANVFPGNSGGPVVLKPEIVSIEGTKTINRAALIGIITSYIPYQDTAISQQTGRTRIIFEENSGLAAVVPSDFIIETVEEAFKQQMERRGR
jgi:S1-C subfamily serine protease